MSLKTLKLKRRSIDKTRKVTRAMEAVSAVKMRKAQERALFARPYARHAVAILKRATKGSETKLHPLMKGRKVARTLFVVVTSDKGLAGNLNSALLKEVNLMLKNNGYQKEDIGFACMGRKGHEHFAKRGFKIEYHAENISDSVSIETVAEMSKLFTKLFLTENYDEVRIFYTRFISTLAHDVIERVLLPISIKGMEAAVNDILPKTGKYAQLAKNDIAESDIPYVFEPSPEEALAEIVPHLVNVEVYHALLEAKASEHSARMVAMKNASDKAKEISRELTLKFNKERQSVITREVSEIIGGIEAMAK